MIEGVMLVTAPKSCNQSIDGIMLVTAPKSYIINQSDF